MKKLRAAAVVLAAIGLIAAILLIPSRLRVAGTFVLKLAKPEVVYVEVEGRLEELKVKNGQWVTRDTVLAKLSNPEKHKELFQRQLDQAVNLHKYLWFRQSGERASRAQAMQHKEFADKQEPVIAKITEQIGKLTLVAQRDGQVVGAPHHSIVGAWLKPGRPSDPELQPDKPFFCEIGDPHKLEAHMILDQSDINLMGVDSTAWLKVHGKGEKTYMGKVAMIAPRASDEVPKELSNLTEGEIPSKPDPKTGAAKPMNSVYEVIIPLDNPDLELEPGLRGYAKIDSSGASWFERTLAWRLLRWWHSVFNFQI